MTVCIKLLLKYIFRANPPNFINGKFTDDALLIVWFSAHISPHVQHPTLWPPRWCCLHIWTGLPLGVVWPGRSRQAPPPRPPPGPRHTLQLVSLLQSNTLPQICHNLSFLLRCHKTKLTLLYPSCIPYSRKFSWDKIFMDGSKNDNSQIKFLRMLAYHAEWQHNYAYNSRIFADIRPTANFAKILSHVNFPLYNMYTFAYTYVHTV